MNNWNKLGGLVLLMTVLVFAGSGCQSPGSDSREITQTEILWDEWGVPHIYAVNDEELFYAHGWAQMHNHSNLLLRLYAQSQGRAAEFFGSEGLTSDRLLHSLGFPALAGEWLAAQPADFRAMLEAFTHGINDYAEAHPAAVDSSLQPLLPVETEDIIAHGLFVIYTRFVAGGDLEQGLRWGRRGSNTYAIGPERSASGHAMLVQNPHLPWQEEFTWMESHLNTPNLNLYGAMLVGFPGLGIAFNEYLGWSHTNNTIDPADLYVLELHDDGYRFDGKVRSFEREQKKLKVKTDQGMEERQIDLLRSVHGPVISQSGTQALALRLPGMDRPFPMLQWWKMGTATNLREFESALQDMQIPFFNVMYADREGNIFYLFNGHVPRRPEGDWSFWNGIVPGDQPKLLWEELLTYDELPKVKNPSSGWLQNANDPPWTSTFPNALNPDNFPPYVAPVEMGFRPQRAVRMLAEDEEITFEELLAYKHSTRMESADRLLDDLFAAVDAYGSELAQEATTVLKKWDRQAKADSKGALLYISWARNWGVWDNSNYEQQWVLEKARATPDGIADPQRAVRILEAAAQQMKETYGRLDLAYGEVMRLQRGQYDFPSNGSDGSTGIFRVTWHGPTEDGKYQALGGDSWVGVIEFADSVRAKVLLSYGNSSKPESPHYGDQLELYSQQQLRDARFYRSQVEAAVVRREVLEEGEF